MKTLKAVVYKQQVIVNKRQQELKKLYQQNNSFLCDVEETQEN